MYNIVVAMSVEIHACYFIFSTVEGIGLNLIGIPVKRSNADGSPVKSEVGMTSIWGKDVSSFDLPEDYVQVSIGVHIKIQSKNSDSTFFWHSQCTYLE